MFSCDYRSDTVCFQTACLWDILQSMFCRLFMQNRVLMCRMMYNVVRRSPWTNQYDPPLENGTLPSEKLRKLEIEANTAFDRYCDMSVVCILYLHVMLGLLSEVNF